MYNVKYTDSLEATDLCSPCHDRDPAIWKLVLGTGLKMLTRRSIIPQDVEKLGKLQTPMWEKGARKEDLKATWLGHACFLVELPAPEGAHRGPHILFDPVFSNRRSPCTYIGPARTQVRFYPYL